MDLLKQYYENFYDCWCNPNVILIDLYDNDDNTLQRMFEHELRTELKNKHFKIEYVRVKHNATQGWFAEIKARSQTGIQIDKTFPVQYGQQGPDLGPLKSLRWMRLAFKWK